MKKFLLDSPQYPTGLPKSEKLKYDTWGRLVEKSKNGVVPKFKYDHFGRLVEKFEGGTLTKYTYDNFGKRLSRITTKGGEILDEYNTYDNFGRLVKTQSNGKIVEYIYNKKNQLAEQIIDGNKIVFEYTKLGQLSGKTLLDKDGKTLSELKYFYSPSGKIISRLANGKLQEYKYDARSQLLAVIDLSDKKPVEEYVYDASGNILKKTVNGKTTTYTYDAANQLASSVSPNGKITDYVYDAAGRLVKEGEKTYEYGWLDKVMRVAEDGKELARFEYHNNNQLAKVVRENGIETFEWDGLALIERNDTKYINEPHAGGGNPVLAIGGKDTEATETIFTDMLGTSLGKIEEKGYSAITKTSFGAESNNANSFFTGKPYVEDLGYAFLLRNYRADMGKWLTQDLIGYPDGWNNLVYCCNNSVLNIDLFGTLTVYFRSGAHTITNATQVSPTSGLNNESGPTGLTLSQSVNHKITVAINMILSVNSNIPKNDSYAIGSELIYIPHNNSMTDSSMSPGVYEAVLAHERAHLQQFINYKSNLEVNLQNQLRELGINEDRTLTSQELSNLTDILTITMNNFYYGNQARMISIARSANAPTISTLTSLGWSNIGGNKWKKFE